MDNVSKLMQYMAPVAKDIIYLDDKRYINSKKIQLNANFFAVDRCDCCGHCCPPESNVYTSREYEKICSCSYDTFDSWNLPREGLDKLRAGLREEKHQINGKQISVYVYPLKKQQYFMPHKERTIDRCSWLLHRNGEIFHCAIHPVRSITCIMPHLRIFYNTRSESTSIGIAQFGRNWALGCRVVFDQPSTSEQFDEVKQNRIEKLERLQQCAEDLNIDTYLPQIIKYVQGCTFDNYKSRLGIPVIHQPPINMKSLMQKLIQHEQ